MHHTHTEIIIVVQKFPNRILEVFKKKKKNLDELGWWATLSVFLPLFFFSRLCVFGRVPSSMRMVELAIETLPTCLQ